ncbi:MAG TPA: PQQ-dependent sugar dehydrogenase [Vicinamibacterales bacterium]|nr:PQQ-dependent sugar dehydrogenase [Vicinamibacterales bacterium]
MPSHRFSFALLAAALIAGPASAQQVTLDPFPTPIETTRDVIAVNFVEFATIPDVTVNGKPEAPRLMHLVTEPGTKRIFVSVMTGVIYGISYDGKTVTPYLDVNADRWGVGVQSSGAERGIQSIAFHPQFNQRGTPGYGKFYVYTDTTNITATPDFTTPGPKRTHDTVLLEWTAKTPDAATYDGAAPREIFRAAQPFPNHNGGQIAFNPLAKQGTPEFGLLYVGLADGGSGGDPFGVAQNMSSAFGKILRIDPLGKNSATGKYGIPSGNPFVKNAKPDALGEIYALGVRNPQRFSWDAKNGRLFVADIGQNAVEEISEVTAGANLGWNKWEASFPYVNGQVDPSRQRDEPGLTWPIVEFDHRDTLFQRAAVTGVIIYRQTAIKQLEHLMIFGDNPSGQIFYVDADNLPNGGQAAIRQILFNDNGTRKTLLQLIGEKNTQQGREPAQRADLRFGEGPQGQILVMNKRDGVIRSIVN